MKLSKFSAVILLFVCAGCVGPYIEVTKTESGFSNPSDPNTVQILAMRPVGPYVEVGTVYTQGWGLGNTAKMHNAIREKAAALGANAVVLLDQFFITDGFGNRFIGYSAVAIKK